MIGAPARAYRREFTRAWMLPLGMVFGVVLASMFGVLSRSVRLDLLSWWPVWLLLLVLAVFAQGRRAGRVRASGLVPLFAIALVVVFLVGHVQGWPLMPSASTRLVGPQVADYERASLRAAISGRVAVGPNTAFLYQVFPVRWGGDHGVPNAVEEVVVGDIGVRLVDPGEEAGSRRFAGWDISVSPDVIWDLHLMGAVAADLSDLELSELSLGGSGSVVLAEVNNPTELRVSGTFELEFPSDAPVRVVGDATIPSGWEPVADGWLSPAGGDGWTVIVVPGASVSITTR